MSSRDQPITVWRFFDGKSGHDIQSLGLCNALQNLSGCRIVEFESRSFLHALLAFFSGTFSRASQAAAPDLIVGAGHGTHLSVLIARACRGGSSCVIMRPSLPLSFFDYCLIPEHDRPPQSRNIVTIRGALTAIAPTTEKQASRGLILVGGPSKHYAWDGQAISDQIREIIRDESINWFLADSPRTPPETSKQLAQMQSKNTAYHPFQQTSRDWLNEALSKSATIWVSEDSISMISEAVSSGAGTGLLEVLTRPGSRTKTAVKQFISLELATAFSSWRAGHALAPASPPLNESDRCARFLLDRL